MRQRRWWHRWRRRRRSWWRCQRGGGRRLSWAPAARAARGAAWRARAAGPTRQRLRGDGQLEHDLGAQGDHLFDVVYAEGVGARRQPVGGNFEGWGQRVRGRQRVGGAAAARRHHARGGAVGRLKCDAHGVPALLEEAHVDEAVQLQVEGDEGGAGERSRSLVLIGRRRLQRRGRGQRKRRRRGRRHWKRAGSAARCAPGFLPGAARAAPGYQQMRLPDNKWILDLD